MPIIGKNLKKVARSNNQVLVLQPATINEIISHHSNSLPITRYVVSMFRIESNNSIRPRRIKRTPWNETYDGKLFKSPPVFKIEDRSEKVEIPIPVESTSETSTNKNKEKSFYKNLEQYFFGSTLHGLKYVGDPSISFGERLFWLCSFLGAICFAAYFISHIYAKYNNSPVIMSLNPTATPLSTLPFPAVTICSMNRAKKSEAERILNTGTDVEKLLLEDYCSNLNTSFENSSVIDTEATKWDNVQKFILRVSPRCPDILRSCFWKQQEEDCGYLFNSALTDEGLCCTFNALPREKIFRNSREMGDLNLTFPSEAYDWNPEKGYLTSVSNNVLPWRAAGAGTHLGLTVVLDTGINAYYCSSTNSIGFKVLLHNPIETPKMADYAFLLSPKIESRVIIVPKIFDANPSIKHIDIKKRMCFFTNERPLLFYRTYTERNCKLECLSNYTLELCDCVPFFLPKSKQKKICNKKKETCANLAKETMDSPTDTGVNCNCLPGCFELGFDSVSTYGELTDAFKIKENIIKNESLTYFKKNMAVVHFYFAESQFTRNTKSEIYGFSEFLSNTGGLLGLFLGFSFLSVVEIGYYLSLRILCKVIRSTTKKSKPKNKEQLNNQALLYPFAK